jgi:peptidoglycan/LPS O-acetylase OafA/YrhL
MEYRKDIQILRGIAVLQVVLFHLEIKWLNSGFLGVDVFFVISGYLMAVIYRQSQSYDFFTRRARRLLPAYFAVIITTLVAAIFVTSPNDYSQVASQSLFATFFVPNIGFWMENSYFDSSAFKPLLHLWSLGVEIQFYILVPVLYLTFNKVKISYPLITLASAFLCFFVVGISPKTAFFWLPFRLWEFLIGFGVAKHIYKGQTKKREALAWLGAASLAVIICIPLIKVDGEALGWTWGHPGLFALLISLATAMTLSFGIPEKIKANPISGLLEKIGDYSYSVYLAHFPLIVMFLYQPFSGTVLKTASLGQTAMLALSVICASAILFKFVEQPFHANKQTLRWVFASVVVVLGVSQAGVMAQKALTPEKEMLIYQAWFDRDEYRCGKMNRIMHPRAISCEITQPLKAPSHIVLLVGNSHADSIKATFSAAAQARNVSVYFMVENNPLQGGVTPGELISEAQKRKVDSIIMHYSPGAIDARVVDQLASLAKENNIRLSFIMPVPVWDDSVPMILLKNMNGLEKIPDQNSTDYQLLNGSLNSGLAKIDYDKFKVYQVVDVLCRSACRLISDTGMPLYFDRQHLTLTGSKLLRGVFDLVISDLSDEILSDKLPALKAGYRQLASNTKKVASDGMRTKSWTVPPLAWATPPPWALPAPKATATTATGPAATPVTVSPPPPVPVVPPTSVTNDTDAFYAASLYLTRNGGGVLNIPTATYIVDHQKLFSGIGYGVEKLITVENSTSPVTVNGNDATLRAADGLKFGSFNPTTGQAYFPPSMPFYGRNYGTSSIIMINLRDNSCVNINNLELDGNSGNFDLGGKYGDTGWQLGSGWCHGLR